MICVLLQLLTLFTNPFKPESVVVGNNYVQQSGVEWLQGWKSPYRDTTITLSQGNKFQFVQDSIKKKPVTYTFTWRNVTKDSLGKIVSLIRSYVDTVGITRRDTLYLHAKPYPEVWAMVSKNVQTSMECVSIGSTNKSAVLKLIRTRVPQVPLATHP